MINGVPSGKVKLVSEYFSQQESMALKYQNAAARSSDECSMLESPVGGIFPRGAKCPIALCTLENAGQSDGIQG